MPKIENIFSNAISIEQMENQFGKTVSGILSFFEQSCCIDTMPPLPPGTGR
jgi:hypothetical protein